MAIRTSNDPRSRAGEGGGESAEALALNALAWIVADDGRAQRFVALTGIAPDDLRARAGETSVLDAALAFLEGHEPDLFDCARAIGVAPIELVNARARLGA